MRGELVRLVSSALLLLALFVPHLVLTCLPATASGAAAESSSVLITEFYPRGLRSDEYVVLASMVDHTANLKGWALCDGEGTVTFSQDLWLSPGQRLSISMNSSSYQSAFGTTPDIALDDDASAHVSIQGTFRLADSGDSVALLSAAGIMIDVATYGTHNDNVSGWTGAPIPRLRPGEVARRICIASVPTDTDSAADWQPFREYKYGFTEFEPQRFWVPAGGLVSYTSPDCSLEVLLSAVARTESTIRVCGYEFSSTELTSALCDAVRREVSVTLLVDGLPSGGMHESEVRCLSVLSNCGATVLEVKGGIKEDIVQHVGPVHAKYAVFDLRETVIQSENFVASGIPADRVFGNRGWGILVKSVSVAKYLACVFDSDSRSTRDDVRPWRDDPRFNESASLPQLATTEHPEGILKPLRSVAEARIDLFISPDASLLAPFLEDVLSRSHSASIEQFQVDLTWQSRWSAEPCPNPLLRGVIASLEAGGTARFLMDSSWFNYDKNSDVLEAMQAEVTAKSLPGSFRLLDNRSPVTMLHNKGAVLDDRFVLVSSNNWGFSSFARNREVAAIVDSTELAHYFLKAFNLDWIPDENEPIANAGPDLIARQGEIVRISGAESTDDRFVASFFWDIFGDGSIDARGEVLEFAPSSDGRLLIRLIVRDTWGNMATDEVLVTVEPDSTANRRIGPMSLRMLGWLVPLGAGSVALLYAIVAKRRNSQD